MYNISLEIIWWALSNVHLIVEIHLVVPEIIANETCSYLWSDISVICYHFDTSHICTDRHYLGLSSATWFVKIGSLVVEIQAEWSLWQHLIFI